MSEIRYDRLFDKHTIIAPTRLRRPEPAVMCDDALSTQTCAFCEGNEHMSPHEIYAYSLSHRAPNTTGWKTRVVPNLFKALRIEQNAQHHYGLFEYWEGFGAHEVIVDTPRHCLSMCDWSLEESGYWLNTLIERYRDLRRDRRLACVLVFKNEGRSSGAFMAHNHTQLMALPFLPRDRSEMLRRMIDYYQMHNNTLAGSLLEHEIKQGERVIEQIGDFISYCPYASGFAFETIITTTVDSVYIDRLSDIELLDLSKILHSTLQRLRSQLGVFHFNLSICFPPLVDWDGIKSIDVDRLRIKIMPRLYPIGGFENATGMMINPMAPEAAARLLRGEEYEE